MLFWFTRSRLGYTEVVMQMKHTVFADDAPQGSDAMGLTLSMVIGRHGVTASLYRDRISLDVSLSLGQRLRYLVLLWVQSLNP